MLGMMRTVAAAGMALATTGAAYAGGPDFKFRISLGGCGPVICPPVACEPVVRYRKETVCDTVPRTEVWYDSCGRRHTRTVYEKVYRTVWVPIEDCHSGATIVIRDNDRDHRRGDDWRDDRGGRNDRRDRRAGGDHWDNRRTDDGRGHGSNDHRDAARLGSSDRAASHQGKVTPGAPARVIGAGRELRGAERLASRSQGR